MKVFFLIYKFCTNKFFSIGYGSLTSGPFKLKWTDYPDITVFDFSTTCSDPLNSWSAIGLSYDQLMVKIRLFLKLFILENKRQIVTVYMIF
jgi:hypothetical protein